MSSQVKWATLLIGGYSQENSLALLPALSAPGSHLSRSRAEQSCACSLVLHGAANGNASAMSFPHALGRAELCPAGASRALQAMKFAI